MPQSFILVRMPLSREKLSKVGMYACLDHQFSVIAAAAGCEVHEDRSDAERFGTSNRKIL
jgi:hypothetical protein